MNHVPLDLHPGNLGPLRTGNAAADSGIEIAALALTHASEACETISALAVQLKADKDLTPSGRTKKFREREADIRRSVLAKLDGTKSFIDSKIRDAELRMSAPPPILHCRQERVVISDRLLDVVWPSTPVVEHAHSLFDDSEGLRPEQPIGAPFRVVRIQHRQTYRR